MSSNVSTICMDQLFHGVYLHESAHVWGSVPSRGHRAPATALPALAPPPSGPDPPPPFSAARRQRPRSRGMTKVMPPIARAKPLTH